MAADFPEFDSKARTGVWCAPLKRNALLTSSIAVGDPHDIHLRRYPVSKEDDNKAIIGRWFTEFWGKNVNLSVVDELASADMLLKYS
jgi:hypothetical protein